MNRILLCSISSFLILSTSCTKPELRPQLFPNGKLRSVGSAQAEIEINKCMEFAKKKNGSNSDTYFIVRKDNNSGRNPEFEHKVNSCLRSKGFNPIKWK